MCTSVAAEAALAPDEEATQVEEGAAVADHEDGEPLVDEAAEEEEHDDAPMIPKECALCRVPSCAAHGHEHRCSSWACVGRHRGT